jgi:hypothetical protein
MLQKWREHGAITYAGYILGFPGDTKQSILRYLEIIKRELPIDILEFLTPLPGSEDHKVLLQKGPGGTRTAFRIIPGCRCWMGRGLGQLLHAGARAHDPASIGGLQAWSSQDDAVHEPLVFI